MGFLSKLFGQKNDFDNLTKTVDKNKSRLKSSANYQVSCSALKNIFLNHNISEESFYNNLEFATELVQASIGFCLSEGIEFPSMYKNLPIIFVSNEDQSKFGYIVAFDDAKYECECNFVAMMFVNGQKAYYTSEFYETSKAFKLCKFCENGTRYFGIGHIVNIQTTNDFKKALFESV